MPIPSENRQIESAREAASAPENSFVSPLIVLYLDRWFGSMVVGMAVSFAWIWIWEFEADPIFNTSLRIFALVSGIAIAVFLLGGHFFSKFLGTPLATSPGAEGFKAYARLHLAHSLIYFLIGGGFLYLNFCVGTWASHSANVIFLAWAVFIYFLFPQMIDPQWVFFLSFGKFSGSSLFTLVWLSGPGAPFLIIFLDYIIGSSFSAGKLGGLILSWTLAVLCLPNAISCLRVAKILFLTTKLIETGNSHLLPDTPRDLIEMMKGNYPQRTEGRDWECKGIPRIFLEIFKILYLGIFISSMIGISFPPQEEYQIVTWSAFLIVPFFAGTIPFPMIYGLFFLGKEAGKGGLFLWIAGLFLFLWQP